MTAGRFRFLSEVAAAPGDFLAFFFELLRGFDTLLNAAAGFLALAVAPAVRFPLLSFALFLLFVGTSSSELSPSSMGEFALPPPCCCGGAMGSVASLSNSSEEEDEEEDGGGGL